MKSYLSRLFLVVFLILIATPFAWTSAQSVPTAGGSITLTPPAAQPQGGGVAPGASAPVVALALTNSGTTTVAINGVALHKSGTAPDTTLTNIGVVDTTANFLSAEATGASLFTAAHDVVIPFPLPLYLQPGETHAFTVWTTVQKSLPTSAIGQTFKLDLVGVQSGATLAGSLPVSGATYTIAANVAYLPPACYMSVNPGSIFVGDSITIRWGSRNATTAYISSIGNVSLSGTLNTLPSSAHVTVFDGTFTGPGGTTHCSASVTVNAGAGIVGGSVGLGGGGQYPTGYSATPLTTLGTLTTPGASATPSPLGTYQLTAPGVLTTASPLSPYQLAAYTPTAATPPAATAAGANPAATQPSGTVSTSLVPTGCGASAPQGSDYTSIPNAITATSCNLCDFGQLIQNIINYMILLTIPLSAGLFGYAGFLYFTALGDTGKIKKAHGIFTSVVMGFVIAISGYLIVQTILNSLLSSGYNGGNFSWTKLDCSNVSSPSARPRNANISDIFNSLYNANSTYNAQVGQAQSAGTTAPSGATGAGGLTEQAARDALSTDGITVNAGACAAGQTTGCTTLAGESTNNIQQIINLKNNCGATCQVVVTGGDEPHAPVGSSDPHAAGTAIDVRSDPTLDTYIKSLAPTPSFTPTAFIDSAGDVYTLEGTGGATGSSGPHWHIAITQK